MNEESLNVKRRQFQNGLISLLGLGTSSASFTALTAQPAAAQSDFAEGRDFRRLGTAAPVPANGKIDVLEFFWYGCPHCHALEPALEAWVKKLPADAAFRRVPVVFGAIHETHAKMYYALEALDQVEALHKKIFAAIHVQHRRLDKLDDIAAFVAENGVDKAKFVDAYNGFGVATKARQSRQLAEAFNLDGVPALGIQGRWLTSGAMTGSNERALKVADFLIARSRKPA